MDPLKFGFRQRVRIVETGVIGTVVAGGRDELAYNVKSYLIGYENCDGRQVMGWFSESALEAHA